MLKRYVEDGKQRFEVVVLPQVLSSAALQLAHEGLGHNGSPRTYALLKKTLLLERFETNGKETCTILQALPRTQ